MRRRKRRRRKRGSSRKREEGEEREEREKRVENKERREESYQEKVEAPYKSFSISLSGKREQSCTVYLQLTELRLSESPN